MAFLDLVWHHLGLYVFDGFLGPGLAPSWALCHLDGFFGPSLAPFWPSYSNL